MYYSELFVHLSDLSPLLLTVSLVCVSSSWDFNCVESSRQNINQQIVNVLFLVQIYHHTNYIVDQ